MNEMPYRCVSCLCPSRSECHRWHELGERRGVLLVQLPPDQERDDDRLDYFLRGLPDGCVSPSSSATTAELSIPSSTC